jgi:hypothetical protein
MSVKAKNVKRSGNFWVPAESNKHYGELTLAGAKSTLYLRDEEYFDTSKIGALLKGELFDLTKVSLINCITPRVPSSFSSEKGGYHYAKVFPHFVIEGDSHLDPEKKIISAVHFQIDDAHCLFYDYEAFGFVLDPKPLIEIVTHPDATKSNIETGPEPVILYFSGKREILHTQTDIGTISVRHNPSHDFGGPMGIAIKNKIEISIIFAERVLFDEAISRVWRLYQFLGLVVGRPQNLLALYLTVDDGEGNDTNLKVYWSMPPMRNPTGGTIDPEPYSILLDAIRCPNEFESVLENWLARHEDWHLARYRFFNSFAHQMQYNPDRLTGAANMFDILPKTAVPKDVELPEEIRRATESAEALFRALPDSPERSSVLGELSRVGQSKLKQKIRHRAKLLTDQCGDHFQDLIFVTDLAVDCRNHFVHGPTTKRKNKKKQIDYDRNSELLTFFTDTLEFVFASSDLIQAGWDVRSWMQRCSSVSHPFARFRFGYPERLRMLKALLQ